MLTRIEGLPPNVVGVEASGEVTAEDYEQVLVPALDAATAASADGKVSVLYVLGKEFPDYSAGAIWQDTKTGVSRMRSWHRIAIVSDADWLRHAINGLGWMFPGEFRVFGTDDADDAREWVCG